MCNKIGIIHIYFPILQRKTLNKKIEIYGPICLKDSIYRRFFSSLNKAFLALLWRHMWCQFSLVMTINEMFVWPLRFLHKREENAYFRLVFPTAFCSSFFEKNCNCAKLPIQNSSEGPCNSALNIKENLRSSSARKWSKPCGVRKNYHDPLGFYH